LQLPDTLMYRGATEPIRLANAHACERANFSVHFNGRISGTIVGATGTPVVGANIVLAVASLADDPFGNRYNRVSVTDPTGAFELVRVPPGDYVLGLNIDPHFENMPLGRGLPGRWVFPACLPPRLVRPGGGDTDRARRRRERGAAAKDGDRKGYAESAPIKVRPDTAAASVVLTVTPR
jgi:Carboxypeptidase regulatory-like domain